MQSKGIAFFMLEKGVGKMINTNKTMRKEIKLIARTNSTVCL